MYTQMELHKLVNQIKKLILLQAYGRLIMAIGWLIYLLYGNLHVIAHTNTNTTSTNLTTNTYVIMCGRRVPICYYAMLAIPIFTYILIIGLTFVTRYKRSQMPNLKFTNNLIGLLLVFLVTNVKAGDSTIMKLNNGFFLTVILLGCIKKGFDYNLKRLHKPQWIGGNLVSKF